MCAVCALWWTEYVSLSIHVMLKYLYHSHCCLCLFYFPILFSSSLLCSALFSSVLSCSIFYCPLLTFPSLSFFLNNFLYNFSIYHYSHPNFSSYFFTYGIIGWFPLPSSLPPPPSTRISSPYSTLLHPFFFICSIS